MSGRGPPGLSGMISLKVDNLTYRTTPDELRRTFEKYGEVGDVYMPRDRFTRESRGFAFVRFYDKRDAEDAMDSMDGAVVDGREVRCQMAKYGRPSEPYKRGPPRRGYGGHSRRSRSSSPRRHRRSKSRSRSSSQSTSRSRSRSRRNAASCSRSKSHEKKGGDNSD